MKWFVLSFNGDCRIIRCNARAPLSEINHAAFGMPYGPVCLGVERSIPLAIVRAREAGFKEAIIDGQRTSLKLEGVAGVV